MSCGCKRYGKLVYRIVWRPSGRYYVIGDNGEVIRGACVKVGSLWNLEVILVYYVSCYVTVGALAIGVIIVA